MNLTIEERIYFNIFDKYTNDELMRARYYYQKYHSDIATQELLAIDDVLESRGL